MWYICILLVIGKPPAVPSILLQLTCTCRTLKYIFLYSHFECIEMHAKSYVCIHIKSCQGPAEELKYLSWQRLRCCCCCCSCRCCWATCQEQHPSEVASKCVCQRGCAYVCVSQLQCCCCALCCICNANAFVLFVDVATTTTTMRLMLLLLLSLLFLYCGCHIVRLFSYKCMCVRLSCIASATVRVYAFAFCCLYF